MERKSGVLLPIFALPGRYGCGNFGSSAYKWTDNLKKGGFTYWQVLPFGIADMHNSPYMPYSSFAGNPYFIAPECLLSCGLVTPEEEEEQRLHAPYLCCYEALKEKRFAFLKKAAMRLRTKNEVLDFLDNNPRIKETCSFLALRDANGGKKWTKWSIHTPDPDDLFAWQFIQYEFHREWRALHEYANKCGVKIIGDIPFYVSHDSYDVYSFREQFLLDERNEPTHVAGVPPDYFCSDGQLWGNPVYNWSRMEKDGYKWWRERLAYSLTLFDGVRLDHFRAISAYWSIPTDAGSAKYGKWEKGPGKKLIDAFAPLAKNKLILAENLGITDADTDALLSYSTYPGMAVFQFGFDGNPRSPHLPHNYKENIVSYTGTHDNNTLLGFLYELNENTKRQVSDYLGYPTDCFEAALRAMMISAAGIVIFPVQDLLGYGADTRINTPGKATGNWRFRVTDDQLEKIDWKKFAHLNKIYAR